MQGEILHFVEALGSNESDEKFVELLGLIGADDIERDQSLASPRSPSSLRAMWVSRWCLCRAH